MSEEFVDEGLIISVLAMVGSESKDLKRLNRMSQMIKFTCDKNLYKSSTEVLTVPAQDFVLQMHQLLQHDIAYD